MGPGAGGQGPGKRDRGGQRTGVEVDNRTGGLTAVAPSAVRRPPSFSYRPLVPLTGPWPLVPGHVLPSARIRPMIHVEHVSRSYQRGVEEVHALVNVSLEIETGHFLAFMGPSGSGKSTLLNLVSGIDRPTSGSVTVAGRLLNDLD